MGDLKTWARENSPFIRLNDGDSETGIYKGWKEVADAYNPGKVKIRYSIEIGGKIKTFDNGSSAVAMQFDTAKEGDLVKITAHGTDMRKRYTVDVLPDEE